MKIMTSGSWLDASNWVFCGDRSGYREELMSRDDWLTQPAMQYHLQMLRLLAMCCKGKNRVTEVQCQKLCPLKDLVKAVVSNHTIWNVKLSLLFLILKLYVRSSVKLSSLANSKEIESLVHMFARNVTLLKSARPALRGGKKKSGKLPGMSTLSLHGLIGKYTIDDPLFLQWEPNPIGHNDISNFRIYLLNFVGTHVLRFTHAVCTVFRNDFQEHAKQSLVELRDALTEFMAAANKRKNTVAMKNTARSSFIRRLRQTVAAMNALPVLNGGEVATSALQLVLHRYRNASGAPVAMERKLEKLEMKHPFMRGKHRQDFHSKVGTFRPKQFAISKKTDKTNADQDPNDSSDEEEDFEDMSNIDVDSCQLTLNFQHFVQAIRTSNHISDIIEMEISSAVKFLNSLHDIGSGAEGERQHQHLTLVLKQIVAYLVESHRQRLDAADHTENKISSSSIKTPDESHEKTSQRISVQLCRILVALLQAKTYTNDSQPSQKPEILKLDSDGTEHNFASSPPTRVGRARVSSNGSAGAMVSVLYMHQLLSQCGVLEMALELFSRVSKPELRFRVSEGVVTAM